MSEWHWEVDPDDLLAGVSDEARKQVEFLAREIATRESMVYLDGASFTGHGPGLRTESRGALMVVYLTDIRSERIVIVQVTWLG